MIEPNTVTKNGLEQLNKQVYYLKRLAFNCIMPVINCLFVVKVNTNHCSMVELVESVTEIYTRPFFLLNIKEKSGLAI